MNAIAIALGGGVRVGLEDTIWFDGPKRIPATNIDLLKRIKQLIELHEHEVMSPTMLRKRLNLQPGFGQYGRKV